MHMKFYLKKQNHKNQGNKNVGEAGKRLSLVFKNRYVKSIGVNMSELCIKCNTIASGLENYGTKTSPLCFDCANSTPCIECGNDAPLKEQTKVKEGILCKTCFEIKQIEATNISDSNIQSDSKTGVLSLEKAMFQFGPKGGIIILLIGILWFVLGYMNDTIFFYPIVMIIIGFFTFVTGMRSKRLNKLLKARNDSLKS